MPVPLPVVEECKTCKFYFAHPDGSTCCRRYPPAAQPTDKMVVTKPDWWCGEYKEKK